MNEIWKDIAGYEDLYEVSNMGRVRSLRFGKTRLLKPGKNTCGYLQVNFYKDGKKKMFLVHRLVADAFIPNPQGYPVINHRDENPANNHVDNLEWCSQAYNVRYGTGLKRMAMKLKNGPLAKQVLQYDRDSNLVRIWPSAQEAKRQLGFNRGHICQCCNGERKSAYGYIWKYA